MLLFKRSHVHEFLQIPQKKEYINFILITLKIHHEDDEIRNSWLSALPNASLEELKHQKAIFLCKQHFDSNCEWVKTQGGSRPNEPSSVLMDYQNHV